MIHQNNKSTNKIMPIYANNTNIPLKKPSNSSHSIDLLPNPHEYQMRVFSTIPKTKILSSRKC
jgi:hypothetical protein